MSAKNKLLVKEYDEKWEINKWFNRPNKSAYFATPVIQPSSRYNVQLSFELKWDFFRTFIDNGPIVSCLELRMFRHSRSGRHPDEMEAFFSIYYSDGRLLHECRNPFPIYIKNLYNCCFDRTRFELGVLDKHYPRYFTDHNQSLENNNFTLKCHLKFYDYISPSEISLKNLQKFNRKLCSMYDLKLLTDFEFKIGEKSLHAHKAVLTAHSAVLEKMVSANFIESMTNIAVIADCSYETFDSFLRYLYSGEIITPSWQNLLELYMLADKYDVSILKEDCADHLTESMTVDRISQTLNVAYSCRDSRLLRATKKFCATLPDI
ncbi:BTB/POZ domain-containing protein 8 [Parasteatoda tepidariorum]|uniref:BTB/POZ domain-containing protein 8 n=1 Tax=Parasteatoda tepidariorum TaxID=114398 RepID=UPI001C727AAF|nr:uncharacterized protein LOC110282711 [Parasteatoda tepidariorum]